MKKEGGGFEWYQSMCHIFLYITAMFYCFLKDPGPLNHQFKLYQYW
jgi:hypothetical protein